MRILDILRARKLGPKGYVTLHNPTDILLAKKLAGSGEPYEIKTVAGNPITLTDSIGKPADSLKVTLEPIQDLHGYDSPWVGGGGKNKLNVSNGTGVTMRGVLPSYDNNGGLNFVGTPTETGYLGDWRLTNPLVLPAGTYTVSFAESIGRTVAFLDNWVGVVSVGKTDRSATFTLESETSINRITISALAGDVNVPLSINIGKIQIESGNQATSYAPYSNICPISGRTQTTVKHYKKNLAQFTDNNRSDYHSSITQSNNEVTVTASGNFSRVRYTFPVKVGATYTLSYKGLGTSDIKRIQYGNSAASWNDSQYGSQVVTTTEATYSKTFTATTDVFALIIYNTTGSTTGTTTVKDFMLEVGDTATTYEPYETPVDTTIQFGQTVYGGEVKSQGGTDNKWKIINLKDLTWSKVGGNARVFRSDTISDILEPLTNNDVVEAFCSCFYVDSYADVINSHGICCIWSASTYHGQLWCDYDSNATLDEFKEVIKNQTFCYKLATPTEINTPAFDIPLNKGNNTLTADGDMELTYEKKI